MDITVLMGSPNQNGSTHLLVESFKRGATGCLACGYEGPCVQKDGMPQLKQQILASDMLVLATPLYYFGMTAQLK